MENYAINLCNSWSIENLSNIDKKLDLDKHNIRNDFAEFEIYKGAINWIFCPFNMTDERIEKYRNIAIFLKKVSFNVLTLKDNIWTKTDGFEGTFIDVLEYIEEKF